MNQRDVRFGFCGAMIALGLLLLVLNCSRNKERKVELITGVLYSFLMVVFFMTAL